MGRPIACRATRLLAVLLIAGTAGCAGSQPKTDPMAPALARPAWVDRGTGAFATPDGPILAAVGSASRAAGEGEARANAKRELDALLDFFFNPGREPGRVSLRSFRASLDRHRTFPSRARMIPRGAFSYSEPWSDPASGTVHVMAWLSGDSLRASIARSPLGDSDRELFRSLVDTGLPSFVADWEAFR